MQIVLREQHKADSARWLLLAILLINGLGIVTCGPAMTSREHPVLDLTKKPPPDAKPMGALIWWRRRI